MDKIFLLNKIEKNEKGEYHLYFGDEKVIVNEDIYTDYFLYENKKVLLSEYKELIKRSEQMKSEAYVLHLLAGRLYSSHQLKQKLILVKKISKNNAEEIINNLIQKGVINDELYTKELIDDLENKGYGYYRIKDTLFVNGIDINEDIYPYDEEKELERAKTILPSLIKKFSSFSALKIKEKVYQALLRNGYQEHIVNQVCDSIDKAELHQFELQKLRKDYLLLTYRDSDEDKIKKKDKIIDKLRRNGYRYSDIIEVIEGEDFNE